jgi:AcrR family transcriptional regulator
MARAAGSAALSLAPPIDSDAVEPRVRVVEIQRSRLLAAAVRAVEELGYGGATVAHITRRARISRRTFYELFSSREECLLALIDDTTAKLGGELDTDELNELPWRERIRTGLWRILCFFDRQPALARVCFVEVSRGGPAVIARREEIIAKLAAAIDEGRQESMRAAQCPPLTAEGLVGAALTILHSRLLHEDHEPLRDLQGTLAATILLPYLGPAAARREQTRPVPDPQRRGPACRSRDAHDLPHRARAPGDRRAHRRQQPPDRRARRHSRPGPGLEAAHPSAAPRAAREPELWTPERRTQRLDSHTQRQATRARHPRERQPAAGERQAMSHTRSTGSHGFVLRCAERVRPVLPALLVCCALGGAGARAALTAPLAGAFATVAPAPIAGAPGLPDGRVYEEASPANKHGNAAASPIGLQPPTILAEPEGNGVAYSVDGTAIGEAQSGDQFFTIAKHVGQGWVNYGAQPRSIGEQALQENHPEEIAFSADLTRVYFNAEASYQPAVRYAAYLYGVTDGSLTWLAPPPAYTETGYSEQNIAGFSADMSTFYFATPSGFYEWHEGALSLAGVLPDGSVATDAEGAGFVQVPFGNSRNLPTQNDLRNEVSTDGSHAFFVASQGSGGPELYVRERAASGSKRTVLVSRDTLLPPVGGLPAAAPTGVTAIAFPQETIEGEGLSGALASSYKGFAYASPDGSHAFFASEDKLTGDAPAGGGMYEFDTLTDSLTYLPGVGASPILVSSQDGSRFIFNSPSGLSLWSEAGGAGGSVTPIEPYPVGGEARSTPDGSAFVFESAAPIAGFNNGGSHPSSGGTGPARNQEIYRYDVSQGSLSCVSCPPAGIVPSGNAYLSHIAPGSQTSAAISLMRGQGISQDGSRVFFDTPDPLVPQDTNTAPLQHTEEGEVEFGRDVYEWENGHVYLISSGTSDRDSYVGDESASGNDVFFATAQGLLPGDTDEGYDVYDARVPRPGDRLPTPAAPCAGDVCQGPPSVPSLLSAPASATFDGLGNPPPPAAAAVAPTAKRKPAAKKCRKKHRLEHGKCVKTPSAHKRNGDSKKGRK